MKPSRIGLSKPARLFLLAGLFSWLAGCVTTPKIDWNSRIGTYTYDQAVLELGPPDKSATLTDGTKVVEWVISHGYTAGTLTGFDTPFYRDYYYPGPFIQHYTSTTAPDSFRRLIFGPDGKLQAWRRVYR